MKYLLLSAAAATCWQQTGQCTFST